MTESSEWKTVKDFKDYECHIDNSDGVKVRRKRYVRGSVLGIPSNNKNVGGNLVKPRKDRFRLKKVPYGQVHSVQEDNLYNGTWGDEEIALLTNRGGK